MELDELKMLINLKLEEGTALRSAGDLETSLRQKTNTVLSKIKRNIWFEFAAFLLCMTIALFCWFYYPSLFVRLFCIATWVFCLVFSGYLYALYKKITFYEKVPGTIKETLQQIIIIVGHFTRLYFRISMGLLPVIFVFGLITGYLDISKQGLWQQFHWSKGMLFYAIVFIVGWSVITWLLSKWYIRKLYGNYLLQLREQLKDIENG